MRKQCAALRQAFTAKHTENKHLMNVLTRLFLMKLFNVVFERRCLDAPPKLNREAGGLNPSSDAGHLSAVVTNSGRFRISSLAGRTRTGL